MIPITASRRMGLEGGSWSVERGLKRVAGGTWRVERRWAWRVDGT